MVGCRRSMRNKFLVDFISNTKIFWSELREIAVQAHGIYNQQYCDIFYFKRSSLQDLKPLFIRVLP